jgi:hypothetical protein
MTVGQQFKGLRDNVTDIVKDIKSDLAATQQQIPALIQNLQAVEATITSGQNNAVASITALRDAQFATQQVIDRIGLGMDALRQNQDEVKADLLNSVTQMQSIVGNIDKSLASALQVIENQLVSRDQLTLRQNGELDRAVETLSRSANAQMNDLATLVREGIGALGQWNLRNTQGLADLTVRGVDAVLSQSDQNRQAMDSAFTSVQQGLNDQMRGMGALAAGGSQILRNLQTIPQSTIDLIRQQQSVSPGGASSDIVSADPGQPMIQQPERFNAGTNDAGGLLQVYQGNGQLTGGAAPRSQGTGIDTSGDGLLALYQGSGPVVPAGQSVPSDLAVYQGGGGLVPFNQDAGAIVTDEMDL